MESYFGDAKLAEQARQDAIDADAQEAAILDAEMDAAREEVRLAVVEGIGWND